MGLFSTALPKSNGFKVGYHMMVGLPGSCFEEDVEIFKSMLWKSEYCPDYLKIYPCIMLGNEYGQLALREKVISQWHSFTDNVYEKFLYEVKPYVPEYVKISRIQRIVPQELVVRGPSKVVDR